MRQLVLTIPDNEFEFILKLLKKFSFVKVDTNIKQKTLRMLESKLSPAKRRIWKDIKEGLNEVKLIEQGKSKGKPLNELLNEL